VLLARAEGAPIRLGNSGLSPVNVSQVVSMADVTVFFYFELEEIL
jgi:hypothetical protein